MEEVEVVGVVGNVRIFKGRTRSGFFLFMLEKKGAYPMGLTKPHYFKNFKFFFKNFKGFSGYFEPPYFKNFYDLLLTPEQLVL